ncbi:Muscle M-line assembly protein unc-89, partial [Frankliniella fusca]
PDYYHHSPQFVRVGSGPEYRLEIPQARLDFTGTYAILARNQHGEAKAIISLQVFAKGQGMGDDSRRKTVKRGKEETLPSVVQPLQDIRCCDGDAVTLECRLAATPVPDVHWKKDGKLVRLSDKYVAEVLKDGGQQQRGSAVRARLRIQRVVPEDEGQYSCVAFNSLGRATTQACLVVNVPEEKENLVSGQLDRPDALRSASSTPRSTPRSTPPRAGLGLREVAPTWPSLDRPRRTRPAPPRFYAVPHNRVAEQGETVRFQCAVAGHPQPWARWDKDGVSCAATARLTIAERDDVRTLEVRDVTPEDAGLYRVVVENDYGRAEATARLEVIGHRGAPARAEPVRAWGGASANKTSPAFGHRPVSQVSRVGGEVTLACDLDGSPAPVTNWYKDGDLVVRGARAEPSWDGRVSRLTLRGLRAADAGVYTCVASNEAGETRCSAQLLVLDKADPSDADRRPPVFVRGIPRHTDAPEGKALELQVQLRGSAPFQVAWLKNGVELPDCSDFKQVSLGEGRFALVMPDMFPEDTATYACEAFNAHGEARTQGTVTVLDCAPRGAPVAGVAATWTKTPLSVMVVPGTSASFCARLSDPMDRPRTVTWTVAGRVVTPDNTKYQVLEDGAELVLHVRRVGAADGGCVQCRVHACGAQASSGSCTPCGAACFDLSCTADLIVLGDEPRDARAASLDRAVVNGSGSGPERGLQLERPAVLLRGPADTTALRGEKVQLTALYAGEPEPTVRWLRAGRELAEDDRTSIRTAAGVSCLALQPVSADHAGKYVVSVENIYGADHHYASLAVE